jgi:integrase
MKGSVMRDPNGSTWGFQFSLTVDGARRHVRRRGFRTKRQAEHELASALAAVGKGDRRPTIAPSTRPLGDYLAEWLTARRDLKPTTRDAYEAALRAWVRPHIGGVSVRDLTPARLAAWHTVLRERGGRGGRPLGSRSVLLAHTLVAMGLADAVEAGLLPVSPAAQMPRRARPTHKAVQRVERVWDGEQAAAFLAATADDRLHPLWAFLLDSGCRRGEASALRWSDVDLDGAQVTVRASRTHAGREIVEGTPKSSRGHRRVDLDPRTVAVLRAWRRQTLTERMSAGPAYSDTGHVFVDEVGRPYRPDGLSKRFATLVERSGLPPIRLHDLRHTSATLALLAGVPVHVVASRLGHDPAVCLRTYAHFLPSSGAEAAARVGAAIYGAGQ